METNQFLSLNIYHRFLFLTAPRLCSPHIGMGALTSTFLLALLSLYLAAAGDQSNVEVVDVGLVIDGTSVVVEGSATAIAMGLDDFYKKHPNYTTRIKIHTRDSGEDAIGAASAALDLLKNVKVQAILGPSRSKQARFVISLGNRTQVPIITFSATSPSLSPTYSPYFVRMALNSSCQVDAIASLVRNFGWRQVVPIYEDADYSDGFLPYLIDAMQDVDARVPYRSVVSPFATDSDIASELYKLMTMQTRVFIVHLFPPLSSRFFMKAKEMGMMEEGYVWIITQGLTDVLHTLSPEVIDSMDGVVGLKPYLSKSRELDNFTARWRARPMQKNLNSSNVNPSIFNLWAYDASWAMAMAVEKVRVVNPTFKEAKSSINSTDLNRLDISLKGPKLLQSILATNFAGLSGDFHLVNGQLQYSAFQIINVLAGGLREVGFWTQTNKMSQDLPSMGKKSKVGLKPIIWPGDVTQVPKGWEVPTSVQKVLKVGVPVKGGFSEFVNTKTQNVTGYCIDIFEAVLNLLPYRIRVEYIPYHFAQHPGSYNDLVDQVFFEKFDAVVGDVTIIANRSLFVDFTLPYTESGVSMVVPVKDDHVKNIWIFLKPLTVSLWLVTLAFFLLTGFVIWFIEHRINDDFRGPPAQQLGTIFNFAFSTMVFSHKEKLESNLSKVLIVFWEFFVLILTSSYTASLASMLTVQRLQPSVTSINDLVKNGDSVGYQDGSFVRAFLEELKFTPSRLKNYSSIDAYEDALSKGSENDGVSAIIDEIPYIKLFLKTRCSQYVMIGPIHKTDGFGFVFPKGSPLVPDISRAILNVTQGKTIENIEKAWFGDHTGCPTESDISDSNRLDLESFWGLFLIIGVVSLSALFIFSGTFLQNHWRELKTKMGSERTLRGKLSVLTERYDSLDEKSHAFKKHAESMGGSVHDVGSARTSISLPPMTPSIKGSVSPRVFDLADETQNSIDLCCSK